MFNYLIKHFGYKQLSNLKLYLLLKGYSISQLYVDI